MIECEGEMKSMTSEEKAGAVPDEGRQCRCPLRPHCNPGSLGGGSNLEASLLARWENEHAAHPYARARDELARALQAAEAEVGGGEAVLDMVGDIFGLPRGRLR